MHHKDQHLNRRFSAPIRGNIPFQEDCDQLPRKGISSSEFIFQAFITIEGPAIFIIPSLFKDVGYLLGVVTSVALGLFYVYMMHIYLWCDEQINKQKTGAYDPSLYLLIDTVFEDSKSPRVASCLKVYLKYEIILSWSLSLSFTLLYAAQNIQLILDFYNYKASNQFILLCLLVPSTLLAWLPNIKAIAFSAYFIICTMIVVLLEVLYYLIIIPLPEPRVVMINKMSSLPDFIFTIFFIISLTPLLFPLRNEMKYPNRLRKTFGGLNLSILLITALNTVFSLEAYFKLGDIVDENILVNLPQNKMVVLTNCLFTISLVGGGALCFFVIFHTVWVNEFEMCFENFKYKKFYEYVTRTVLSWFIVLMAMVIPTFSIFINLISCFSYPFDSILLPIILESVIVRNNGESTAKTALILSKNILLGVICVAACLVAFYQSLVEILAYYDPTILPAIY